MLKSFEEVYPFLCGIFLTIGIIYLLSFNWNKANRAYTFFGLISLLAGFWFGFARQVASAGTYSTYAKIFALPYSLFILLLPWFVGYYGPLWKPKWLWFISFLMITSAIVYRVGPEIYPTPWLYFGFPAFLATFLYGILSARLLLKEGSLRKGFLFLIANAGSLFFVFMHSISEFFGNPLGIKNPESVFLIEGFIIFFLLMMTFELLFDIKLKSRIERKLAHQMERWQQTLDEVELVIVELNFNGIVRYVNPYFTNLTGFESKDVLNENWFDKCIPNSVTGKLAKAHQANILDQKSFFLQNPILTANGKQKMIYWSNVVLRDDNGKTTGTLSIGTDVTDSERAFNEIEKLKLSLEKENTILKEEVLQKGNYDVIGESDVINQAIQKVKQVTKFQELDRLKSQFFANISHEFRTPLTLILNPIKAVLAENKDKKIKKELSLVERNATKLLQMVNQLLDLSKLESGKMNKSTKPGDLARFIKLLATSFDSLAEYKSISFKKIFIVDSIATDFNEDHLEKVINNVLSNAFKFTDKKGKVTLLFDLMSDKQRVLIEDDISENNVDFFRITVRDTGVGISPEAMPHIFDRFYQADNSVKRSYEGTGIGLALVKELVDLYNGKIDIKSEIGWGTEVAISLPLDLVYSIGESQNIDDKLSPVPEKLSTKLSIEKEDKMKEDKSVGSDTEKEIVLVVEDNTDLREHIRSLLTADYKILESKNGVEGFSQAIEHIPDLIISDVMMPKMDGIELTDNLKKDQRTSHIPIILLTAKSTKEDKLAGLKTGADEYLAKPFDQDELKVRIENLIQIRASLQKQFAKDPKLLKSSTGLTQEEQFLKKATSVVDINIENDQFSVEDLASELGMSRVQFHRKIKALTNQSTTTFIRTIRLEKAKDLLAQGDYNVTEVAYMVGFSSQSYFTKSFQKHFGTPPSNFQV